jgi:hypothetical protein
MQILHEPTNCVAVVGNEFEQAIGFYSSYFKSKPPSPSNGQPTIRISLAIIDIELGRICDSSIGAACIGC